MQHIASRKASKGICIITVTHALPVGYIAKMNEVMSTCFLGLNLQDPLVVKYETNLRKADLDEYKNLLIDLASSKSTGKKS
jgi:hypothetical protein